MTAFEQAMIAELTGLLRAGVPVRAVHLTVRELVVTRIERGPLGAREVSDTVESAVRAACHVMLDLGGPDELVESVCRAALDAVRGHGGESSRWLTDATRSAHDVLDEMMRERPGERWPWVVRQLRW